MVVLWGAWRIAGLRGALARVARQQPSLPLGSPSTNYTKLKNALNERTNFCAEEPRLLMQRAEQSMFQIFLIDVRDLLHRDQIRQKRCHVTMMAHSFGY